METPILKPIPRLSPNASADDVIAALEADGAVIIEHLASPSTMEKIEAELEPHWENTPYGDSDFIGLRTQRATRLIAISTGCRELAMNPLLLATMDRLLLPMCERYHLHVTNGVRVGTQESEQMLHRDDELFRGYIPRGAQQVLCNVIWALSDFTAENGATRIVTGSHGSSEDHVPDEADFVQAEMPSGSVALYMGSTFHGAGRNTTDHPRTGIIIGYSLGWLRQEENQYLAVPPEVARTLPVGLQELIGYAVHPPFLGWVDMKDPRTVIGDVGHGLLQPAASGKGS